MMNKIRPFLWFDTEAEDAARFYTGIFKDSRMGAISHFPEAGQEVTGKPPGSVMTVEFELNGQTFIALNGGPHFKFNESISFEIECADQAEVDYYWDRLCEGGDPAAQQCGWLKDKFELSWQVVPTALGEMMSHPEAGNSDRLMEAFIKMRKIDIESLEKAYKEPR